MIKNPEHEDEDNEQFLSRWSRRKQALKKEKEDEEGQPSVTVGESAGDQVDTIPLNTITVSDTTGKMITTVEADNQASLDDGEAAETRILTDEDMPAVDDLTEDSDYAGFLSPGVSEKLRKVALRKLFAGAGFNIRDGLDDYDDDFTNFPALGDIVTCDMKHQMELAEERKRKAEQEAAELAERKDLESSEQLDEQPLTQQVDAPQSESENPDEVVADKGITDKQGIAGSSEELSKGAEAESSEEAPQSDSVATTSGKLS